jgi:glycosyltransferase involved in cell wall biosynthesis
VVAWLSAAGTVAFCDQGVIRNDDGSPRPRFSVVVPAYNESALLHECLDSLAGQDFVGSYEVIVVDNNSTDRTAEIARLHGAIVVSEPHAGVCWARQTGTLAASGEIVVSTDADTTFPVGWLSRIDESFTASHDCVAVTGPCRFLDAPWWGRLYAWALFHAVSILSRVTGRVVYASATNIAFRVSAFEGYDTKATQGGDELGLLRCLRSRGAIVFDLGNPSFTSARRLRQGLVYNVVVTFLYYYLLGYCLNRLLGRALIGTAPAFRVETHPVIRGRRFVGIAVASLSVVLYAAGLHWSIVPRLDHDASGH